MIRKVVVALISSLLFCVILAWFNYIPAAQQQPNTYYWSFFSLVAIYLIYAIPVYIVGGVPVSILIEALNRQIAWANPVIVYLFRFIAYAVAGMLLMMLFQFVTSAGTLTNSLLSSGAVWGMLASILYLHVWLVSFWVVKEKRRVW
ncbi:hypothetical protein P4V54_10795 [Brevibacillus nitrificans]|uniref:hypothetical protein n=1 Tax=Brevibacillus nitrificans TaxID=651560 RepID=UPI002E1B94BA|nr:hypothetical protein [Brevibacillus nitrificans]